MEVCVCVCVTHAGRPACDHALGTGLRHSPGFSLEPPLMVCLPPPFSMQTRAAMPRSPTSSEDEMARSYSDSSEESDSDSPKEETIYDTIRATAQKPGGARAEEGQAHMLVLRIVIEDLQQTVRPPPAARLPAHGRRDLGSRGLCLPPAPPVPEARAAPAPSP